MHCTTIACFICGTLQIRCQDIHGLEARDCMAVLNDTKNLLYLVFFCSVRTLISLDTQNLCKFCFWFSAVVIPKTLVCLNVSITLRQIIYVFMCNALHHGEERDWQPGNGWLSQPGKYFSLHNTTISINQQRDPGVLASFCLRGPASLNHF